MTNRQILKKVIKKAIENGYKSKTAWGVENFITNSLVNHHYKLIFSHNFAKCFFGKEKNEAKDNFGRYCKSWEYHLTEMVLEKEPLKYLEKFL